MAMDNELKSEEFYAGEERLDTMIVGNEQYVREPDGTWRYADTWIKVPGARDLTLTERFNPKFIVATGKVERVVVSGADIAQYPDLLNWCLEVGVRVEGDGRSFEVLVPIEKWEERERIPSAMVAPEHSADPAERELAQVEREYREADQVLSSVTARRAEVLRNRAEEITRQRAAEITDLSIGRVHQLIREDTDDEMLDELDMAILGTVATRPVKTVKALQEASSDETGILYPTTVFRARLRKLEERELVFKSRAGFQLSPAGHNALVAERARRRGLEERAID